MLAAMAALMCSMSCATMPHKDRGDLKPLFDQSLGSGFKALQAALDHSVEQRVQILVSEVVPDGHGGHRLNRFGYRVGAEYFYPASCIKLCAAVAALQCLEALQASHGCGDLLETPMEIAPLFTGDLAQTDDASNLSGGRITVGHEIRKLALVSDNRAFNRLYDLVGHDALNRSMQELGLSSTVVNHRLSESRVIPDPRASAAVTLRPATGPAVTVPARHSTLSLTNLAARLQVGEAYMKGEQRVSEPMDFSTRNGISLQHLQDLLIQVVAPEIDLGAPRLRLEESHRRFLVEALTQPASESLNPVYGASEYPTDAYKTLLPGVRRVLPEQRPGHRVECASKIGQAYGFTIENACLRNPVNGRTVFVSAVIYTNADGVLNDDQYEYAQVALPFMADLGEWVARNWLASAAKP